MQPDKFDTSEIQPRISCYHCGSRHYVKKGIQHGRKRYECKECNKTFYEGSTPRYKGEYPSELACTVCGSTNYKRAGLTTCGTQRYVCKDCGRRFVLKPKKRQTLPISDDVWDAETLGVDYHEYLPIPKIVFVDISQDWLKHFAKKFISYMANIGKATGTLAHYATCLRKFSKFLEENYSINGIDEINRDVIVEFLTYLKEENPKAETRRNIISDLNIFFETGKINQWFDIPSYLIRSEDSPNKEICLPRYMPEEVMQQLNQHLDALPDPIMRMILVIQECGLRVGELLTLPINCLKRDSKGDFSIQFMRHKMKKEDSIPVSSELAGVIQEQQQYVRQNLANNFQYLFCGSKRGRREFIPEAKIMTYDSFRHRINDLFEKYNICDSSGKRWQFQTHQFRHTVGTRMINMGVPHHIVQRYLGHDSPTMTMRYAYIHNETLKKELSKYHETRVVNIAGETIELERSSILDDSDLEWFKNNVLAMALPHGYCSKPKVLGKCMLPPNSCLNCAYLRTNKNFIEVFKDELKRTNEVLAKAKNYAWEVQISMNEPIKENLEKLIKALEADND